ncbi:hypothetical protein Dda_7005 [Drechslerella dactyloides]|uniref:CCHC-type domain-containing protein n=1 Tax=Drechslerella dactyloides TaxID=74499 RepID=A0AAD6IV00_DREDA|nr:hypothetical protein Dda_7005 [Drechslerella dactyloides]
MYVHVGAEGVSTRSWEDCVLAAVGSLSNSDYDSEAGSANSNSDSDAAKKKKSRKTSGEVDKADKTSEDKAATKADQPKEKKKSASKNQEILTKSRERWMFTPPQIAANYGQLLAALQTQLAAPTMGTPEILQVQPLGLPRATKPYITCYNCLQKGHTSPDCPNPVVSNEQRNRNRDIVELERQQYQLREAVQADPLISALFQQLEEESRDKPGEQLMLAGLAYIVPAIGVKRKVEIADAIMGVSANDEATEELIDILTTIVAEKRARSKRRATAKNRPPRKKVMKQHGEYFAIS